MRDIGRGVNKENKPEEVQPQTLLRSSSVFKIDKPASIILKGSASTSRMLGTSNNIKIFKYWYAYNYYCSNDLNELSWACFIQLTLLYY
jgi:hypothetical protein